MSVAFACGQKAEETLGELAMALDPKPRTTSPNPPAELRPLDHPRSRGRFETGDFGRRTRNRKPLGRAAGGALQAVCAKHPQGGFTISENQKQKTAVCRKAELLHPGDGDGKQYSYRKTKCGQASSPDDPSRQSPSLATATKDLFDRRSARSDPRQVGGYGQKGRNGGGSPSTLLPPRPRGGLNPKC